MTAVQRSERAAAADALCVAAYADSGAPMVGAALVAVGGYGRKELAPYSDLDVVLVHADDVELGEAASSLWYPLWDSGFKVDHSVRSLTEMIQAAEDDIRVAMGLLDMRHVAGDPNVALGLRTTLLAAWRRDARHRMGDLRSMVEARHATVGELAHVAVPDIKEAQGGLRDTTVLNALVSTWLVDVHHVELSRSKLALLDLRDHVHEIAGRATDRIAPEMWPELAVRLGAEDAQDAQRTVREIGRRVTHLSRLTFGRVSAALERPVSVKAARKPDLTTIALGVAISRGEVMLDGTARVDSDPLLLLRAAAEASERNATLAPVTAARLVREGAPLPSPWPAEGRQLMVRLLAGPGLLEVWETLEETGALHQILPEWERIRVLPHATPIHRFTVDRHVIETCLEAAKLIRNVARVDVLMVSALLHDIGKGGPMEHCLAGEPIARAVAQRMGFDDDGVETIASLVRWHLLLPDVATTRDPDDPSTIELVTEHITRTETLALLHTLTEADGKAASPAAWTVWRANLIATLVSRVRADLVAQAAGKPSPVVAEAEVDIPRSVRKGKEPIAFVAEAVGSGNDAAEGARVTVMATDRVGLLADVAAVFAIARVPVLAARVWNQGEFAVSVWDIGLGGIDVGALRDRYDAIVGGSIDPRSRLASSASHDRPAPSVAVHPEASRVSTVLEVRTADQTGVVYRVCSALAELKMTVKSAHVATLGPQAVDVFYVQERDATCLTDERAESAADAVRAALTR